MKTLSLKLKEEIFEDLEVCSKEIKLSRNAYINKAVDFYNKTIDRIKLKKMLKKESLLIRESSMEVLKEMEALDGDIEY